MNEGNAAKENRPLLWISLTLAVVVLVTAGIALRLRLRGLGQGTTLPTGGGEGIELVFASNRDGDWELYGASADGSYQVRLTHDPDYDFPLGWSEDGQRLYISKMSSGSFSLGGASLWLLDLAEGRARPLHKGGAAYSFVGEAGDWALFVAWHGETVGKSGPDIPFMEGELYKASLKDGTTRKLYEHAGDADLSPDRKSLLFIRYEDVNDDGLFSPGHPDKASLLLGDLEGSEPITLSTNLTGMPLIMSWRRHSLWSPDGEKIAFAFHSSQGWGLKVIRPDGTLLHELRKPLSFFFGWDWSPQGSLAFAELNTGLHVIPPEGGEPQTVAISSSEHPLNHFSWSPDGQYLLYAYSSSIERGSSQRRAEIHVVRADGSEDRVVATIWAKGAIMVEWSPDGHHIVFCHRESPSEGPWDIFVVDREGRKLTRLTENQGSNLWPLWRPK